MIIWYFTFVKKYNYYVVRVLVVELKKWLSHCWLMFLIIIMVINIMVSNHFCFKNLKRFSISIRQNYLPYLTGRFVICATTMISILVWAIITKKKKKGTSKDFYNFSEYLRFCSFLIFEVIQKTTETLSVNRPWYAGHVLKTPSLKYFIA